jgi:hypothetical protein
MSDERYYSPREELMIERHEREQRDQGFVECRCGAMVYADERIICDGCGKLGCTECMTHDAAGNNVCLDDDDCLQKKCGFPDPNAEAWRDRR